MSKVYEAERRTRSLKNGQTHVAIIPDDFEYFKPELFGGDVNNNFLDPGTWARTIQAHAKAYNEEQLKKPSLQSFQASNKGRTTLETFDPNYLPLSLQSDVAKDSILRIRALDGYIESATSPVTDKTKLSGPELIPLVAGLSMELLGSFALATAAVIYLYEIGNEISFQEQEAQAERQWESDTQTIRDNIKKADQAQTALDDLTKQINKREDERKKRRDRKRDRKKDDDDNKKKRKDNYFGCVTDIEPLEKDRGWEVRIDAIADNSLSDDIFLQEIQNLVIAANPLAVCGLPIYSIFVYFTAKEAPALKEGDWLDLKLDMSKNVPATKTTPDLSGTFEDKTVILQRLTPQINFLDLSINYFFDSEYGDVVRLGSYKAADATLPPVSLLTPFFNGNNDVQDCVQHGLALAMTGKTLRAGNADRIKTLLSAKSAQATVVDVRNVGQGACGLARSGDQGMFVSDFGYGKGEIEPTDVCTALIYGHYELPILLSHWDVDHYRIAMSDTARLFDYFKYSCRARPWIAPDVMTGIRAPNLAKEIANSGEMVWWPKDTNFVEIGNIAVLQCSTGSSALDKNNNGSLALLLGTGSNRFLYPGDANFEYIYGVADLNNKISVIVATHHGSLRSLNWPSSSAGASIPLAADGDGSVVFSYGAKNSYGHSLDAALPYYTSKGYKTSDATANLSGGADTIDVTFEPTLASQQRVTRPAKKADKPVSAASLGSQDESKRTVKNPAYPSEITLAGSNSKDTSHDDLATYAVRDKYGDIVAYNIIASKVIVKNHPLCIPCTTDYPVEVRILCQDLEVQKAEGDQWNELKVRFNVADAPKWSVESDPGQAGRKGEPGFMGGFLNLSVAGEIALVYKGNDGQMARYTEECSIKVQYTGGHGSDGQKGGRGADGTRGTDGKDDIVTAHSSVGVGRPNISLMLEQGLRATAGGKGGDGLPGGAASDQGGFAASRFLGVKSQINPKNSFAVLLELFVDEKRYASPSAPGIGGNGGRGGPGGIEGKRYKSHFTIFGKEYVIDEETSKQAANGADGNSGGFTDVRTDAFDEWNQKLTPVVNLVDSKAQMLAMLGVRG
jgi:hypothetical protein